MPNAVHEVLSSLTEQVIAYLPSFVAGLVLVAIGWAVAWLAKRAVIETCALLKVERFLQRFSWGKNFSKADVRDALFGLLGNFVFFIVLLIFISNALGVWKLTTLSALLERGVIFFPQLLVSGLIFLVGWLIAVRVSLTVQRALLKERVPRATLVARFIKAVLLLFFAAMALVKMDVAREIVIIGFTTALITLGVLAIILTAVGAKDILKQLSKED